MDKQYGVVSVRFINKGDKLSSKEYSYNVDEKLYKKLASISFTYYDIIIPHEFYNKFLIVNENGYDYKNTPVVFTELYQGPYRGTGYSDKDLVFLSSYMYDGQTSIEVEEEKKEMWNSANTNTNQSYNSTINSSSFANLSETIANCADTLDTIDTTSLYVSKNDNYSNTAIDSNWRNISDIVADEVEKQINKKDKDKERKDNNMFENLMKNVKFGKVTDVFMSVYGPAFKSSNGEYISYDKNGESWIDVTGMTIDMPAAYMIPVAKSDVEEGDFILHNNTWVRVIGVEENKIEVEKILEKEVVSIVPTKNLFGFDYYTKLVSFGLEGLVNSADESNPFGNFIPFFLMGDNSDLDDILPLMLMMNSKDGASSMNFNDPLMLYILMGDGKSNKFDKMLPLMLMMNQNK